MKFSEYQLSDEIKRNLAEMGFKRPTDIQYKCIPNIQQGEELTLNYASFLDEHMEPFNCRCGAANCCGWITGITHNSVTEREIQRKD